MHHLVGRVCILCSSYLLVAFRHILPTVKVSAGGANSECRVRDDVSAAQYDDVLVL